MQKPLEASYYTDPAVFERDRRHIFHRAWSCVCHTSEVASPGDYVTHDIAGESIFLVRGRDGVLRGFFNFCRHRGHPIVEGKGRVGATLVCAYHAWSYGLDGRLKAAPGATAGDLDACGPIELKPVRLDEFCGFVFATLYGGAPLLTEWLSDLAPVIRSYHPDPARLRFICETEIEHQCNWKVSVENYNECYHCPTVHRTSLTRGVLSMAGYTTRSHGPMIWHEGRAQTENEKQYDYDVSRSPRAGDYGAYWIWPNVAFCCYPGGFFTIRQWLPVSWRKTIYRYRWFSDGDIPDADVEALMLKHKATTGAEDEAVVSKVQKGMESIAFEPGPYILGDGKGAMSEVGSRHFHLLYREAMEA